MSQLAIGVTDEDYKRIVVLARNAGRRGVKLTGRSGTVRFYFKGSQLMGDSYNQTGEKVTQEVVNIAKLPKNDAFTTHLRDRLSQDHPEMSKEEVEMHADILNEANETIKRLIEAGIAPDVAHKIVCAALKEDAFSRTEDGSHEMARSTETVEQREEEGIHNTCVDNSS